VMWFVKVSLLSRVTPSIFSVLLIGMLVELMSIDDVVFTAFSWKVVPNFIISDFVVLKRR